MNITRTDGKFLTDAVVTDAAVRRSRWSEDLAGVAVLELDDLVVDLHVADSRWGSLPCGDVPIGGLCGNKKTFISRCWQSFSHNKLF